MQCIISTATTVKTVNKYSLHCHDKSSANHPPNEKNNNGVNGYKHPLPITLNSSISKLPIPSIINPLVLNQLINLDHTLGGTFLDLKSRTSLKGSPNTLGMRSISCAILWEACELRGKEDILLEPVPSEMPRQRDMPHMLPKAEE